MPIDGKLAVEMDGYPKEYVDVGGNFVGTRKVLLKVADLWPFLADLTNNPFWPYVDPSYNPELGEIPARVYSMRAEPFGAIVDNWDISAGQQGSQTEYMTIQLEYRYYIRLANGMIVAEQIEEVQEVTQLPAKGLKWASGAAVEQAEAPFHTRGLYRWTVRYQDLRWMPLTAVPPAGAVNRNVMQSRMFGLSFPRSTVRFDGVQIGGVVAWHGGVMRRPRYTVTFVFTINPNGWHTSYNYRTGKYEMIVGKDGAPIVTHPEFAWRLPA